jgi:putative MATE family efflux protein
MSARPANDAALDPRTRRMLEAPIVPTLLRLGAPNILVMFSQAAVGLIETYFVGKLGTDALAGMALVFPMVMLMQMMSAGAMGGGITSSIARALGARRRDDADALVLHAILIALAFGLAFTVAALAGGRQLYSGMGGSGGALDAALIYSTWVFSGAIVIWLFNSLAAVIRGTGNMAFPAIVMSTGAVILIPLSPLLIFGWGPVPALGIAGGAVALLTYYVAGTIVFAAYLWSSESLLRPSFANVRFKWALFADILRVGLVGAVSTVATNVTIAIGIALVGAFGIAAIAGYGTASRLEYLLVPLVFGLGAPLVAMVGTCIGAGQRERALRATWVGAAMAFAITEAIGLWAAFFPYAWLSLFDSDPAMLDAGAQYLRTVGPVYGFFGLGLVLYFASQGAGRLWWPVIGNVARLAVAGAGGWLALQWGGGLTQVFIAQAVALVIYGAINALSIAGGAWFGPVGRPRSIINLLRSAEQS